MIRLGTGPPTSTWAALLGCLLPMVAIVNLGMGALCWTFITSSELNTIGAVLLVPLLALDAFIALMLVQHYRNAYWLDGRVLVRRVLTGRRRYDVSASTVTVESASPAWTTWYGGALPRLVVRPASGAPVRMWLRDPTRQGTLLPPDHLAALARAIDPALRHPVAARLWQLASDPLAGPL
ncbi:hypothetical protein [Actinomadura sediminis]|uniref:PH domain-containing protein n=1 Tax=Actinomadura sediminis TaxID=1038904 RepID=A0ABW3ENV6_9ACTN